MPLPDVAIPVVYMKQESVTTATVLQRSTARQFKERSLRLSREELDSHDIVLSYDNGTTYSMGDGEKFGHRLENCKELLVLSRGQPSSPACSKQTFDIDPWFFNIPPDIQRVELKEDTACLLAACFGEFWESVFYRLGFNMADVSHTMESSRHNEARAACSLLCQWHQREVKAATFQELVSELLLLHKSGATHVDWGRVKAVMTMHVDKK
ncbi:uncharacterized protein LOC131949094 [Physella acuta]|uniref:uncharacterized protein LOC131949094 n=1 Tax=Physella acuta TaxID=109671 RepID=UPI0027DD144D|nr:uncharacterized protein LOC131949094 [Physella acuta]